MPGLDTNINYDQRPERNGVRQPSASRGYVGSFTDRNPNANFVDYNPGAYDTPQSYTPSFKDFLRRPFQQAQQTASQVATPFANPQGIYQDAFTRDTESQLSGILERHSQAAELQRLQYEQEVAGINADISNNKEINEIDRQIKLLQGLGIDADADAARATLTDNKKLRALAAKRLGLTMKEFDQAAKDAKRARKRSDEANVSKSAAMGVFHSQSRRNRGDDIAHKLSSALENIRLGREGARAGYEERILGINASDRSARARITAADIARQVHGLEITKFDASGTPSRRAGLDVQSRSPGAVRGRPVVAVAGPASPSSGADRGSSGRRPNVRDYSGAEVAAQRVRHRCGHERCRAGTSAV